VLAGEKVRDENANPVSKPLVFEEKDSITDQTM
jgi:hypothetical protein